jgi:hypothetical protein
LTQTLFSLSKKGYGSIKELQEWDTDQFLDAVEFESICADIEYYEMNKAQ